MRWYEIISEDNEDIQEINLVNNYDLRKNNLKPVGHKNGYDITYFYNRGQIIFYISKDDIPLGYCATHSAGNLQVEIQSTFITKTMRSKGLGTILYKAMIEYGFKVISDWSRSPGADALWQKLSNDPSIKVTDYDSDSIGSRFIAVKESTESALSINWVEPKQARSAITAGDETSITIDVHKIDKSWAKDSDFYISGPNSKNAIGSRYGRFAAWLQQKEPVEMPEISLDYRNEIAFTNGRHRFAFLRDQGLTKMPVIVPVSQADEIKQRFG